MRKLSISEDLDQGTENLIGCEFLKELPIAPGVFPDRLLFSYYYSVHVVFILRRLTVRFAFETEDGCRSSETCIKQNRVLLFEDYFLPAVC